MEMTATFVTILIATPAGKTIPMCAQLALKALLLKTDHVIGDALKTNATHAILTTIQYAPSAITITI